MDHVKKVLVNTVPELPIAHPLPSLLLSLNNLQFQLSVALLQQIATETQPFLFCLQLGYLSFVLFDDGFVFTFQPLQLFFEFFIANLNLFFVRFLVIRRLSSLFYFWALSGNIFFRSLFCGLRLFEKLQTPERTLSVGDIFSFYKMAKPFQLSDFLLDHLAADLQLFKPLPFLSIFYAVQASL